MVIHNVDVSYDFDTHTPYPSLNYVRKQTGEDMTVNVGSEQRAIAEVRQITDEFKRVLKSGRIVETFNFMEFLIATDEEWNKEFIKCVTSVIYQEYNTIKDRREVIKEIIAGSSLLAIGKFAKSDVDYEYRVGY